MTDDIGDCPPPWARAIEVKATEEYGYQYPGNPDRDEARLCRKVNMSISNSVMKGVLEEAEGIVCGDRQRMYGLPEVNHKKTAEFWSTYLGIKVTPVQVCMMNDLQKTARSIQSTPRDIFVDKIGFVANAYACQQAAGVANGT